MVLREEKGESLVWVVLALTSQEGPASYSFFFLPILLAYPQDVGVRGGAVCKASQTAAHFA